MERAPRLGRPVCFLAAAAVVVAAAVVALISAAAQAVVATATEQDEQDDDPAHITAAETVITHNEYLHFFMATFVAHSKVFRSIKFVRQKII